MATITSSVKMSESSIINSPLPPSVEKAYHQKCIDLKRRLMEVEASNDQARLRKRRLDRSIMKMRMERAILLEHLVKVQKSLGDDSEEDSPPQSPRLPRRRITQNDIPSHQAPSTMSAQPEQSFSSSQKIDRRAPTEIPLNEALPQIHFLPSHTNVIIVNGEPKHPPWTIRDIAPRHHLVAGFDHLPSEEQMRIVEQQGYLPYDSHGNPVLLREVQNGTGARKWRQVFRDDAEWTDPVMNNIRTDDPYRKHHEAQEKREEAAVEVERVGSRGGLLSREGSRRGLDVAGSPTANGIDNRP